MSAYMIRRLIQLLPVAFLMSVVVFSITNLLPGDPTIAILGEDSTPEQRARLRAELGLDDPLPVQYTRWLSRLLQGDLGHSLRSREPVAGMLWSRVPVTVELIVFSSLFGVAAGIPAGVVAATRRNTWMDGVVRVLSMVGVAMPYFWLGVLLILLASLWLGWLPPSGYVPFTEDWRENLKLMILPSLTVGAPMAAVVMRQTRSSMLEVLSADFIRTAKAKGLGPSAVTLRHALRNALVSVTTIVGLQIGALLGGAVVTETVFALPGLGRMVVNGIFQRDFPVIQGAILFIIVAVLLLNLVTDLLYAYLDPRIKF